MNVLKKYSERYKVIISCTVKKQREEKNHQRAENEIRSLLRTDINSKKEEEERRVERSFSIKLLYVTRTKENEKNLIEKTVICDSDVIIQCT